VKQYNKPNIAIITFEYGKNISGGIGSCLNGFVPCIQPQANLWVLVLYWNFEKNYFSCIEYECGFHLKTHKEPLEHTILHIINTKNLDIVHIHHAAKEMLTLMIFIRNNNPDIKFIYSCHSIFKHEKNVRAIFDEAIAYEQDILNLADAIHVLSEISKTRLVSNYPELSHRSIHVIPNGVGNTDFLLPGLKNTIAYFLTNFMYSFKRGTGKTIICASRWAPGKGIEFYLDAIPIVLRQNPDVKFLLVGQRNNTWDDQSAIEYKQFLQRKIDALQDGVKVYGWIGRWQLSHLIKKSNVYIMPSECESFPYSFLEPAFLGTTIIASKIDTVNEMANDGQHFLGFETGNHADLAEKINALINDEPAKNCFSSAAKRLCDERYSWNILANKYLHMYKSVRKTHPQ
jgi:glycosyltransferase involved in cell wall biosynthesis